MGSSAKLDFAAGAIILAAGLGNRLKALGPKPFLLYKGKSFIEIAVENAAAIQLNPQVIITNEMFYPRISHLNLPAKILINPHPERGMLSSILIGLNEIKPSCSGFFLCPIDYPLVKQSTYNKLLLAHRNFPDRVIKPVIHHKFGHPIVIPENLFQAFQKALLDQSAKFVISQYAHLTKSVEVTDPGILININTPELYHRYCD